MLNKLNFTEKQETFGFVYIPASLKKSLLNR